MTVLNIDGAMVIFEGIHRLQWLHQECFRQWPTEGRDVPAARTLSHVWPDKDTGARIRRCLDQRQRVVVLLEDRAPVIALARHRVPRTPAGAIEMAGSDNTICLLEIPPFTWLAERHRRRGENFASTSALIVGRSPGRDLPKMLIEDPLIGTREPLRFVYGTAPITFGLLRNVIDRLYRIETAPTREVTDLGLSHPDPTELPVERRRAA